MRSTGLTEEPVTALLAVRIVDSATSTAILGSATDAGAVVHQSDLEVIFHLQIVSHHKGYIRHQPDRKISCIIHGHD